MVNKMAKIKITQIWSIINRPKSQKATITALGLGKSNRTVEKDDTPQLQGMIQKVSHLVKVQEV
jgi:large subunit ribosomal protein L30